MNNKLQKSFQCAVLLALCLSFPLVVDAETYTYDAVGRLTSVTYDDGSSIAYNYDTMGNLLEQSISLAPPPSNEAPSVNIVGGNRTVADTDQAAGELVSMSAAATDSDGTIVTTQWLINEALVATGLTPDIVLPDGQTIITFKATDNEGAFSTDTVTITTEAPPLEPGWPVPYSGITPDESLGLALNNISALNPQDGLIYACLRVLSNGLPSSVGGIDKFDIAFEIISVEAGTISVARAKPFNGTGALNENGEFPDCSGSIELTTNIYEDIIQASTEVYSVQFELFDGISLILRILELSLIGIVP